MLMPRRWAVRGVAALAAGAALASCTGTGPTGPVRPAEFVLTTWGAQPVPAVLGATAGGRRIELVSSTLRFERWGRTGAVSGTATLRVTDPGAVPVTEARAITGSATRRGDTVTVAYASRGSETFLVEDAESRLRTVATDCGPNPCLDVLVISVFRRVPAGL